MKVVCLSGLDEIAALRTQINALNFASPRPDPFSTCEFYLNFIRHVERPVGDGIEDDGLKHYKSVSLWFLGAFDHDELIGYLALKLVTQVGRMGSRRKLDFLVGNEADRPHVVARLEHLEQVTAAFYRYLGAVRDWDFLELEQQDASSPLYPLPRSVHLRGCWIDEYPAWDNCTIRLRWSTMEEYYRALSHNLRSALKRQLRKLLALGRLELITSMDPEATPALFDLYCSIESRSWKSRTHVAISRDPARVQYFKALLDARQPMQIVIQILLLDGVPIAGLLSGSFCGPTERGLYGLQAAFDRELSAIAPGSIILLLGMRYAILGGYAIFNLLSGFGYYKSRWLAESTSTRSVQIYRIGNLLFWRRLCGNVARYLHLRKELPSRSPFNPLRRSIDGEGNVRNAARGVYKMSVGAEDRAYYEGLVSRARQSKCEFLSTPELLVALEFMKGASMPQMKTRPSDPVRTSSNSC